MEPGPELVAFKKLYTDAKMSILNPVHVASLLRQERVVADDLLDEVSDMTRFTLAEKTASIMRHVEGAVRVNPKSFWVFVSVLERSGPSACHVAKKMRDTVDLHTPGDLFVSEVYREDFDDIIKGEFISLHRNISQILANNDRALLHELKELLASYSELEGPLQAADTISSVMRVVQRHSSVINCFYLKLVAKEFNLPEVTKKIEAYCKQVDKFCQQTIRQHSYVTSFMAEQQNNILSTQTLTLKLEWKPDDKTLADIQSLIRKTFKSLSDHVHVVVIKEGSVTVICYAPHYIMGTLVQMAKESKSMLLENSVSYLSIGYTVVLDQETEIRDLTQENIALQLSLTALQEQLRLQLQSKSDEMVSRLMETELPKLSPESTEELPSQSKKLPVKPALYQSKSESMLMTELPKFTSLGSTEKLPSQSPLLEKSDKPALYQSKSDEMMSMLMGTESGSTLPAFTSLQSTELSHSRVMLTGLTPDGIKYLMEHQMIEGIEYFVDETPEQQEAIFQGLRRNISLRELDVPFTPSPVNMSALSVSLTINNTLQDLKLQHVLDDHAMKLLSSALQVNRSLHRLTLGCTDTGAQHLSTMLTANTTLRTLDLSSSKISDTGILHISEALKHNNSLTDLYLSNSKHITNTGAVALSKMLLENNSLKRLYLCGTSVGEEGAAALMESLLHNQMVTWLILPKELKAYYKQHELYDRVKSRIT